MRRLEHGNGVVGEVDPEGSVTGVGMPNLLSLQAGELGHGDVLAGRYQIEAVIGTGGSGRVLRAFDRESRTLVALKILRQDLAGEPVWSERFSRELRVGRAISHPNVCRVFDIGDADGHKFLSMELATGGSIRVDVPKVGAGGAAAAQAGRPQRSWDARTGDARAILEGVAALHRAGIVHRDLKPENILRMEDGRLVVTDFGLATDPGSGPGTTIMVGTPSYMAPEVVMGDPGTMRSDVWGLGVVMHEVFFGIRPQWKVLARGMRRYVRPEEARTGIERAVADLCGRCAADAAELRPAAAVDVLRELERALRGKQVVARHVRHRMIWGATAAVAVAGLVVVKAELVNKARASSSQVAVALESQVLQPTGTPADWSKGSTKLASFSGRLHCYAMVDGGKRVRAIWGAPRKAEDIDVSTGARKPANLLPETYQDGCPALSPDGKSLLFEKASERGTHIFSSPSPSGAAAKQVVRGSAPTWLPNGQEFVFSFDSRHAAMFSLPTGEMSLVVDGVNADRQANEHAVSGNGDRIAVRYATNTEMNEVVVYSIPSLTAIGRALVPPTAERIVFGPKNDEVFFSFDGPEGVSQVAYVDILHRNSLNVGRFSSTNVYGVIQAIGQLIVADHTMKRDLWSEGPEGRTAVTSDGQSLHGAQLIGGSTLIQRRLPDGRIVLVAREQGRGETQITNGPLDATPAFLPDGHKFVFARLDKADLVECSMSPVDCRQLHSDDFIPGFPSPDPTGEKIAYLTLKNSSRIRVWSREGKVVDLGPAGGDTCAPIWTSSDRLWIAGLPSAGMVKWTEIDCEKGQRTGDQIETRTETGHDCVIPPRLVAIQKALGRATIFAVSEETSDLVRTLALAPAPSM